MVAGEGEFGNLLHAACHNPDHKVFKYLLQNSSKENVFFCLIQKNKENRTVIEELRHTRAWDVKLFEQYVKEKFSE